MNIFPYLRLFFLILIPLSLAGCVPSLNEIRAGEPRAKIESHGDYKSIAACIQRQGDLRRDPSRAFGFTTKEHFLAAPLNLVVLEYEQTAYLTYEAKLPLDLFNRSYFSFELKVKQVEPDKVEIAQYAQLDSLEVASFRKLVDPCVKSV